MAEYIDRDKFCHFLFKEIAHVEETQTDTEIPISLVLQSVVNEVKKFKSEDVQPVKWISVYDQLPDYNMVVLVTDGEDVGTGYRYALGETGFMGWAVPFADIEEDDVSHWMPLPEPPKDGEA